MLDVRTRSATLDDVAELATFWARVGENATRPEDRPDLIARLIEHDRDAVIVAVDQGRIVATIVCGWDGWRASLYRLAVDPDVRGQGLGRHMLALAELRLVALGAERVNAMVLDDNDLGQSFWSSVGYTRQADWSRWVKVPTPSLRTPVS